MSDKDDLSKLNAKIDDITFSIKEMKQQVTFIIETEKLSKIILKTKNPDAIAEFLETLDYSPEDIKTLGKALSKVKK